MAAKLEQEETEQRCIAAILWLSTTMLIPANMYGSKRSKWLTYHVGDMVIDKMIGRLPVTNLTLGYAIQINQIEITHDEFLISYYRSHTESFSTGSAIEKDRIAQVTWVGDIQTFENEITFMKLAYCD